jgi:hypothetical protein
LSFQCDNWEQLAQGTCGQSGICLPDGKSMTAAVEAEATDAVATLGGDPAPNLTRPTGTGCLAAAFELGIIGARSMEEPGPSCSASRHILAIGD